MHTTTKHIYIEGKRVCSKIGSGFKYANVDPTGDPIDAINGETGDIASDLWTMVLRGISCTEYNTENVSVYPKLDPAYNIQNEIEKNQYFYHSDHLGSSSFISDVDGNAIQHLQYLPFGETFIDERESDGSYNTPYKFSGKEKDDETQYSYFGARYYDSDLSVWLSVDPLADENQGISPFNYCHWNPVVIIDPDGNDDNDPYWHDKITDKIVYTNHNSPPTTIKGDWEYMGETFTSVGESGNTEFHDECNEVYNSVPLNKNEAVISYEEQLKKEYPNSYIFYHNDKNYGPPKFIPANGSIEIGVSGAGGYGAGVSLSLAWDEKGHGAFQVNLEESGGIEVPNINLSLNSYTPLTKSFSVKDMAGPTSKKSGGIFMLNYGNGENFNYNGINGNIYKVNSFGLSIGVKSFIPVSGKKSLIHTFQLTW